MDVLFQSFTNSRNKYPTITLLTFLALSCMLTYIFFDVFVSSNTLDALGFVLMAAILSYALVYHIELILYLFIITGILSFIVSFLPIEYKIYYARDGLRIFFYFYMAIFLLPPVYDLYMYYNRGQAPKIAAGQIAAPPQSAGSSHKKRK